jgi:hypothetical protein
MCKSRFGVRLGAENFVLQTLQFQNIAVNSHAEQSNISIDLINTSINPEDGGSMASETCFQPPQSNNTENIRNIQKSN